MKALNLNGTQKATWSVTLPDGTKLLLTMPTKRTYSAITAVDDSATLDDVYDCVATVLSQNRQGKAITPDMLDDCSVDDIKAIFVGYMEFVNETIEQQGNA